MNKWSNIAVPGLTIPQYGEVELRDVVVQPPGLNEMLIKTEFSGVSVGTEMAGAHGRNKIWGELPFTPGYQGVGRIIEFGEMTEPHDFKVGDLVAYFSVKGTHRSLTIAPLARTHRVQESSLSKYVGLFVQPCVAANAINKSELKSGDKVLVIGQGMIGQCTAFLAKLRGAHVVTTDVSKERLAASREFCAHEVFDTSQTPCSELVMASYPQGFDIAIESTGIVSLVDEALKSLRFDGTVVFEGHYPGELTFDFDLATRRQLKAVFPFFIGEPKVRESVIAMIVNGEIPMQKLVSHEISWRDAAQTYNKLFGKEKDSMNGILIDWRDSLPN
jgi:2-desacetyl-2-hydroxyethyl bacteriochlorophyllide A dehydrogenase